MRPPVAKTPKPPYFAVIFYFRVGDRDRDGYQAAHRRITAIGQNHPGYLGEEAVRRDDGEAITVLYYDSAEAIDAWRRNADHGEVKRSGRKDWYDWYKLRIARVEEEYPLFKRNG